jgi:hypothetical protein
MLEVISSTRLFTNFAATYVPRVNVRVSICLVFFFPCGGRDLQLVHRGQSSISTDRACRSIIAQ